MQSLEPYTFQYIVHTFALNVHCEQGTEMYNNCVTATVALIDASLSVTALYSNKSRSNRQIK